MGLPPRPRQVRTTIFTIKKAVVLSENSYNFVNLLRFPLSQFLYTAHLAHLPRNWAKWADLAVLFSW